MVGEETAAKWWCQSKLDGLKLSEEEARDPTRMKASTFARWIGLVGAVLAVLAGGYVVVEVPGPAGAAARAGQEQDDGYCMFTAVYCFIVCWPVAFLEARLPPEGRGDRGGQVAHFVLKPKVEQTEEELKGPPPPKAPGITADDVELQPEQEEEEEGEEEGKPGCCFRGTACLVRSVVCRFFYEGWYSRAVLYILLSVLTFPCGITIVVGIALVLCALLYAFAKWRGEIVPEVPAEEQLEDAPAEDEMEVEEKPKKEKKRKKRPAKQSNIT